MSLADWKSMDANTRVMTYAAAKAEEARRRLEYIQDLSVFLTKDREEQRDHLAGLARAAHEDDPERLARLLEGITRREAME